MGASMISDTVRTSLEKQQYGIVGKHSAVKVCGYTKKDIKDDGCCYKGKFYGISSHECIQITPNLACANRCYFCWRHKETPLIDGWKWGVDDPEWIWDECVKEHVRLLNGFRGNEKANMAKLERARQPKHVALSLVGEPILYPKIKELVYFLHNKQVSTFLVTNGQHPDAIASLPEVTQLYVSIDAPNKKLLQVIDKPIHPDFWERLQQSLRNLAQKKERTVVRLTIIKGRNDVDIEGWCELIRLAQPDAIEVKGYSFIGASRQVLSLKQSPFHEEVLAFAQQIASRLGYSIISDHAKSCCVLASKHDDMFIDFPAFFERAKKYQQDDS